MRPVHDPDRPRPDPREFPLEPESSRALRLEPEPSGQAQRFFVALRSRARIYAGVVAAATLLAAGISLLLPSWYRAKSTLLPPTESSEAGFGLLSGMIKSSAMNNLGLTTTNTPSD